MKITREATVQGPDGAWHSVFQQNTIAVRVEWVTGIACVVVFPVNWLAQHSIEDRETILANAMYGAGACVAVGQAVVVLSA